MINEPSVDVMIRKLGTEEDPISRYALCTIAAKRARQIIETERNLGVHDSTGKDKELLTACKDIADGKVVVGYARHADSFGERSSRCLGGGYQYAFICPSYDCYRQSDE